ncbi:Lhr family ATP-dependent helicase, partial [Dietzia sp.]|uniref:Lhr family ATP-dependent helicase n=1 Tax=Dietzia sp. TaxID=1871616 RepID=UPI002FDB5555
HTVIIDEVHALAGTKRGAHLALSLERLDALAERAAASPEEHRPAQRIGLSATVADPHTVARFLAGERPVEVVAPPSAKSYELSVRVPVEDLADLSGTPSPVEAPAGSAGQGSIWPHIERQVVDLIVAHRSTLVFVNSRRLAERLSARINEIHASDTSPETLPEEPPRPPAQVMVPSEATRGAAADLAMAHHGSVSKERRSEVEHALKTGELRAVVATSSLELGIDMGAVDLVIQVESPGSVASGLQRVGRAGHNVGDTSVAVLFPKHRADLVHSAITVERMLAGAIEKTDPVSNPLDVLAQQTIAAASMDEIDVEEWFDLVRRAASFSALPRAAFTATLDMLAGKYPSTDFAELRPRIVWDRDAGVLRGRPGAQRLAVTSGGTIADRGMFGVFMVGDKPTRVGELDEEMVYESRIGDVFALGATSWRIEEITHDRVVVSPAPAHSGRLPFWRGDEMGRPIELGRALGEFLRDIAANGPDIEKRLEAAGLDSWAKENLRRFVADQLEAAGVVPSDHCVLVERFRDEIGDWRVVLHSPFGAGVHRPWAEAIRGRLASRHGFDPVPVVHDDGIILRVPDLAPGEADAALDLDAPLDAFRGGVAVGEPPIGAADIVFESGEAVDVVTAHVSDTALFASKFRECAGRAMLLPRLDPGKRAPLWQQRQKSAQLLDVAKAYPDFPIILESVRECLQDVYDVPALVEVLDGIASREIRVVEVTTPSASPFAAALMFDYVGAFVYESDGPLAERRAAALSLDPSLLGQLLGRIELRELLDPGVLEQVEDRLQHRAEGYKARDDEGLADLLRLLGPLTETELAERAEEPARIGEHLFELERQSRAARVAFAGAEWWVAAEDLGRLRDALGVPPPPGTGAAFLDSGRDPLGELVRRYARTHAPFTAEAVAQRFGIGTVVARGVLDRLTAADQLVAGEFRPAGSGAEWCDPEVLRRIRRRSLAELRAAIEPVEQDTLGRFLPAWQGLGRGNTEQGVDGLLSVIEQLDGVALPLSAWESLVLAPRVRDFEPSMLDELLASGEVLWCGRGRSGARDGLVSLHPADSAPLTLPTADIVEARAALTPVQALVLRVLERGGGLFFRDIVEAVRELASSEPLDDGARPPITELGVRDALWALAWSGLARGDTFSPLRAVLAGALPSPGAEGGKSAGSPAHRSSARGRGGRGGRAPRLGRARLG